MTPQEQEVYASLNALDIPFERHEHAPVVTVEEAERHWAGIDATHSKNLFLRNQKGDRHYLVIVDAFQACRSARASPARLATVS